MAQLSSEFLIKFNKNFEALNKNLEKIEKNISTTNFVTPSNCDEKEVR